MKAIISNNKTYKITSERGDFFYTEDSRGKCEVFRKKDVDVVEINAMPKAKKYAKARNTPGSHARLQRDLADARRDEAQFLKHNIMTNSISISGNRVAIPVGNKTAQFVCFDLNKSQHEDLCNQLRFAFDFCKDFDSIEKHMNINGFDFSLEDIY